MLITRGSKSNKITDRNETSVHSGDITELEMKSLFLFKKYQGFNHRQQTVTKNMISTMTLEIIAGESGEK